MTGFTEADITTTGYEYRLVDGRDWQWPNIRSNPEDLVEDLIYMETRHPGNGWKIQARAVSEWEDITLTKE